MTDIFIDYRGVVHTLPALYEEFPVRFQLLHTADKITSTEIIREPQGWGSLKFILERDPDWHGMNYENSDENQVLEFDGYSGRDFIEAIRTTEGPDATILFQQGIVVDSKFLVEYEGRLNLSTYNRVKRKPGIALERNSLAQNVKAKWDTKLQLLGTKTLDDTTISRPTVNQLPLTSQSIGESFANTVKAGGKIEQTYKGDANVYITFDTSEPQTSEIEEFASGKPLGLSNAEGPLHFDEWLFKFRSSGVRNISLKVSYRLWLWITERGLNLTKPKITGWNIVTQLVHRKAADKSDTVYDVHPKLSGGQSGLEMATSVGGTLNISLDTAPGDKLFLFSYMSYSHTKNEVGSSRIQVNVTTFDLRINGQTSNASSLSPGLMVHEALSRSVAMITNLEDRFRSTYYGLKGTHYAADGCGSQRLVTSGLLIRGVMPTVYTLKEDALVLSLRDQLLSWKAIDGIGLEYGVDTSGPEPVDIVRAEKTDYFYRDVELLSLVDVGDFSEEEVAAELYSTITTGYETAPSEGAGIMEEFCNKRQFSTPIKNESTPLELVSPLMTSGLAIEETRRNQFADTPKDSTQYDNNGFIIQCQPTAAYSGMIKITPEVSIFQQTAIEFAKPVAWLAPGLIIAISGTVNYNRNFEVISVSQPGVTPFRITINKDRDVEELANMATVAPATTASPFMPELGADFDNVLGLTNAASTYNIRLSPGRMFRTTAPYWSGCLVEKGPTAIIKQTDVPQNKKLMSQTNVKDACDPMAGMTLVDGDDIALGELDAPLWLPIRIRCKARLTRQQVNRLRAASVGLLPPEKDENGVIVDRNYGYITVPDEGGQPVKGYIMKLEWEPQSEWVTLELRKKFVSLDNTSGNCTQFASWSFETAELAEDEKRERLEFCRYSDLDIL